MRKIYVLDTNVLIHDPQSLFAFADNHVVLPMVVLEEMDTFKKNIDEKGRNARQIGRYLDNLRKKGSLRKGVKTDKNGIIQIVLSHEIEEERSLFHFSDKNDNLIIGTALHLQNTAKRKKVILISKDVNVRIKADTLGIQAENFETNKVNFEELFTGISDLTVSAEKINSFKEYDFLTNESNNLFPNQFIKLINKENKEDFVYGKYVKSNNTIYPLTCYKGNDVFGIKARNNEQKLALELLLDETVKMVSLVGKAGTGKTLLAMAAGLNQVVEENKYSRLIISRPISPLGKDLGALPGTKTEKFNPWMAPIYDNMEILINGHNEYEENKHGKVFGKKQASLEDYLDYGFIELEPLTYIRGRSLPNQYIIVDEAQNLTPHEMKTIITRAGEGTKIVLTGDPYQIDIPYLDSESNGLSMAAEKLKPEEIVGHVTLQKGERSQLADIAAKYF
ncbi:MAG: phosphate starvation-inducible protein PhoH [Candidatus Cloacimonadota bacterium]|nr:MAG: phosphate starvation-inducible protein PhoH [Candidatus Cloacimonadota bacterium]